MVEQDVILEESMSGEQLISAGKELKKQLNKANKMVKKLEQRYIVKLKELKQSNKLVEENENSIEVLEEEIGRAKKCLNLVFKNDQ